MLYNKDMNPIYEYGKTCLGPVCDACRKCGFTSCSHTDQSKCGNCHKKACACPEPFLDIDKVKGKTAVYRVNDNGKTTELDLYPGIQEGQTDTALVVDIIKRLLRFSAERHTDTITASELGAILHLNDLGDVSTKGAENGSTLVYKKTDKCGEGCVGTGNEWVPWNALDADSQVQSAAYAFGYDRDGNPVTLQQPSDPDQFYNVAWNGSKQLSYSQYAEATALRLDSAGFAWQPYIDPKTKEIYYVKVKP